MNFSSINLSTCNSKKPRPMGIADSFNDDLESTCESAAEDTVS